jgi:choline kinase
MDAILLAAGQGKRFGGELRAGCKVLIEVGGECLLDRHLDALFDHGVTRLTVVVGFEAQRIEARLAACARGRAVETLENPRFREGSLYSLYLARDRLGAAEGCLVMDADVLYDPAMIGLLTGSAEPRALLFDGGFLDDEMRVGLRGGRAVMLGKKLAVADYEAMGRGPGFYKVDAEAGRAFAAVLSEMVAEGLAHLEYEDAFNRLFERYPFAPIEVRGRPWTEIDNLVDLEKARTVIWPQLQARR